MFVCVCVVWSLGLQIGFFFFSFVPPALRSPQIHVSLFIHVAPGNKGEMHIDVMHCSGEELAKIIYKETEKKDKRKSGKE